MEAIKLAYDRELKAHNYHTNAVEAARAQIIKAVPKQFLSVLATADMGLGDVLPLTMWTHLWNTYGTLTDDEAEANRQSLTAVINIDEPLETVWERIITVQQLAPATAPISDGTAITLTLQALEATGVFTIAIREWRLALHALQTMVNFRLHFDRANRERIRLLPAAAIGLQGANNAIGNPRGNTTADPGHGWAYCHTHGLSNNHLHTSASCTNRAEGHQEAATFTNPMGGSNIIRGRGFRVSNNNRNRRAQQQQPSAQT